MIIIITMHFCSFLLCSSLLFLSSFSPIVCTSSFQEVNTISNKTILEIGPKQPPFHHNFCESKLQNNKGPEIMNSYTSLIISIVPIVLGFPKYPLFYNVACMLAANGVASYHYHYYLDWVGKQADEISMILANYFGLWGLINVYYKRSESRNRLNRYNTAFMYSFLVFNTLMHYDELFPSIFGVYVGGSLYMIYQVAQKYKVAYKRYLLVSLTGAISWIICEHFCNHITKYGHPLWHVFFPLGFYQLLLEYDKLKMRIDDL